MKINEIMEEIKQTELLEKKKEDSQTGSIQQSSAEEVKQQMMQVEEEEKKQQTLTPEEEKQQVQEQQRQANVFSSQLLSQILTVGALFSSKAYQGEGEKQVNEEEEDEELERKEIFDTLLKKRIFYSDRVEKVENVMLSMKLIPKDTLYCSP